MQRRTFEILAKWLANEQGVKVQYEDIPGPMVDMNTKTIKLPFNIKEANVFSALAQLMHEAAHVCWSTAIPKDVAPGAVSHEILNVIEDVRIDLKNFGKLPNIKEFYRRMVHDHVYPRKNEIAKENLMTRVLINAILHLEGFSTIQDQEALEFAQKHNINGIITDAISYLDTGYYDLAKVKVRELMDIFGAQDPPQEQVRSAGTSVGNDSGDVNVSKYLHPADVWSKGRLEGASMETIGTAALREITKQNLKELLNIKETCVVHDGRRLDTDNLIDFFTGQIERLFKDDEIIKRKRSKIIFLLDASGSMRGRLLDKQSRRTVVTKCVKAMCEILDEVQLTEGLDVQYKVHAFNDCFIPLEQANWEKEYFNHSGGTCLLDAFRKTQEMILADTEIDGNKLIIILTDGDVDNGQIEEVRNEILKYNQDVRCMFMGVGADINGAYKEKLIGDNNILAEDCADQVIMDVVEQML